MDGTSAKQGPLESGALHIRNAEGGDAAAYVSYMNEIGGESDYLTFGLNEYGRTVAEVAGMIASMSAKTNELFLLAFVAGRVVGALMLESGQRPRVRHAAELSITVRREYWSRGVGPALMDRCRQWLEETRTLSKVNLRVREDHARAIRLYEKKGFVTEGLTTRALHVNGQYYGVRHMGLTLDL